MHRSTIAVPTLVVVLSAAAPVAAQSCPGDFDGDNQVTVDELLRSVDRALLGCPPPVALDGPFDGQGVVARTACADPGENDAFVLDDLTITFTRQEGSTFEGRLDAVDGTGEDVSLQIAGSVDGDGLVRGSLHDEDGDVSGTIHGGISGDGLSLAVVAKEPNSQCSISASLLTVRRR